MGSQDVYNQKSGTRSPKLERGNCTKKEKAPHERGFFEQLQKFHFYFIKRKNPLKKYPRPITPDRTPRNQKYFCFMSAAMDESRIAI